MNIFVAGVHGVGKTFLSSGIPMELGLVHTSASSLIKEERGAVSWNLDKKVSDLDGNQRALAAAVERRNSAGTRLLLDGHFVVFDSAGGFSRIGVAVFRSLNFDGVVLVETDPATIVGRLGERDGQVMTVNQVAKFLTEERDQAKLICGEMGIPLVILDSPSLDTFIAEVSKIAKHAVA